MKTNKQIINALTKDAIDSAFVITAIEFYAKQVKGITDESEWQNAFINLNLWKAIADNALDTINNRNTHKPTR
jgi:predicted nucleotide-binding protein (sugar kinase/HSP70/actin superfamily)